MNFKAESIFPGHKGITKDMVDVAMGIEQPYRFEATPGNKVLQFLALASVKATGINDDTITGRCFDDIGIFLKRIECKTVDLKIHVAKIGQMTEVFASTVCEIETVLSDVPCGPSVEMLVSDVTRV